MTGCFIALTFTCLAQDVIITRDAKKIEAKVVEVNVDNIRYRRFEYPDGPLYTLLKSEIASILYESGQIETFETESSNTQAVSTPPEQTPQKPQLGRRINLYEMQRIEPLLFQQYSSGRRQSGAGTALIIVGLVSGTVGGIVVGVAEYKDDYFAGVAALLGGGACVVAGIPLKIVGESRKRNAINNYRMKYSSNLSSPHFQLNVQKNGFGLAYMF